MISILVLDKNNNNVDDTCAFNLNSSDIKTLTTGRCCNWFKVCQLDLRFFVLVHLEINEEKTAVTVNIGHEHDSTEAIRVGIVLVNIENSHRFG